MIQIVAFATLPGGGRPMAHPLAELHCYLAIQLPSLDCLSPLARLRVTENDLGVLASGPLDLWVGSVYDGCQPNSSDFDIKIFNLLHQELSDLGARLPFTKRFTPQGFILCRQH